MRSFQTNAPKMLKPCSPGSKLTQKDNANSGAQFIILAGPKQSLLLAKDLASFCDNLIYHTISVHAQAYIPKFLETSLDNVKGLNHDSYISPDS